MKINALLRDIIGNRKELLYPQPTKIECWMGLFAEKTTRTLTQSRGTYLPHSLTRTGYSKRIWCWSFSPSTSYQSTLCKICQGRLGINYTVGLFQCSDFYFCFLWPKEMAKKNTSPLYLMWNASSAKLAMVPDTTLSMHHSNVTKTHKNKHVYFATCSPPYHHK